MGTSEAENTSLESVNISKAQQSTAKHSKAQQSTAKHSKAQQSRNSNFLLASSFYLTAA